MKKILLAIAFGAIVFGANAQVKVLNNGNVGIGITNPTYKLDCIGTARFSLYGQAWDNVFLDGANQWGNPQLYCKTANFIIGTGTYPVEGVTVNHLYVRYTHALSSDERLKENVKPLESTLSKLLRVAGKSYNYKRNEDVSERTIPYFATIKEKGTFGFIAQELEMLFPELVYAPDSINEHYSINYIGMIPVLVEAIKEQQNIIEDLQQEVKTLRNALVSCCSNKTQKSMQEFDLGEVINDNIEELKVFQNAPNPFTETTIISCYIPETIKKAELCIYDMTGSRLKCLTVTERGAANIQIQAGQLAAGVYTYLLIGDGKNSDAKQMILTK
jgi:hypothetical protein